MRLTTKVKILAGAVVLAFVLGLAISLFGGALRRQWGIQRKRLKLKAQLARLEAEKVRLEKELEAVEA